MLVPLLLSIVGLAVLVGTASLAVSAARQLARRVGVSDLVVGLTITSIGTSLPELATSAAAAIASHGEAGADAAGLAVGNILGSNLFLLTALLGAMAVVRPVPSEPDALRRDAPVLAAATVAILLVGFDGVATTVEGVLLMVGYGAWLLWLGRSIRGAAPADASAPEPMPLVEHLGVPPWIVEIVLVLGGLTGVVLSANLVVQQGVILAQILAISGTLVGILVGIGTSLPELAVSVQAARSGAPALSLGNVIGSAITNLLLCFGLASVAASLHVSWAVLTFDWAFTATATAAALMLLMDGRELSRAEGGVLLLIFALYVWLRITLSV